MIEMFALGQIHQIRVAKCPQVACAIFIDTERFWIPPRTICLERHRKDLPALELTHAAARGDPDRARTGDVDVGNKISRQPVLRGKCFHLISLQQDQPHRSADPQITRTILRDARDRIIQRVRADAITDHPALGVAEQTLALRADP